MNSKDKELGLKVGNEPKEDLGNVASESTKVTIHPLELAAEGLFHKARDTEECVTEYVPLAEERHHAAFSKLGDRIKQLGDRVQQRVLGDRGPVLREIYEAVMKLDRLTHSNPGGTLRTALFLNLLSAFDVFVGEEIAALFDKKPELFFKLQGEVKVGDVIRAGNLADFKQQLLSDYIDDLRRKSYVEQFDNLANLFDLATLKQFDAWPDFVEISQRRNLVAHSAGRVSQQYLRVCKKENVDIDASLKVGDQLLVTEEYMTKACRVVMEVGLKLVQTLWRKILPDELKLADTHLNWVAYQALQLKEWDWAKTIGEYARGLPRNQTSTEQNRLIALINLAIAFKFNGDDTACRQLLEKNDWSATIAEFKLAVAVLHDDFDKAGKWMKQIGKSGEILNEDAYHTWPLFRDFRASPQFLAAYESVYGYQFRQELIPTDSQLKAAAINGSIISAQTNEESSSTKKSQNSNAQ